MSIERVWMSDGAQLFTQANRHQQVSDRPAILLIHGGPGLWDYLEPLDALLDDLSVVFRYDQRGCGRSSVSDDLSMARYISDIEDLRAHWSLERLVLVGHSFGAALALAYAGSYPDRAASVGYLSGVGIGDWMTPFRAEVMRRRRAFGSHSRIAELSEHPRTAAEEVQWRRLVWSTDYADTALGFDASREMAETPLEINNDANRRVTFTDEDQRRWATEVSCPVFFLHGAADPRPASQSMALAAEIPNARTRVIEGAGHLPWTERPDDVRDWLAEVTSVE